MKEKLKEIEVKYSTFTNFNIPNKKTNISSMVNQMDESEFNNIKLISKGVEPSHLKNNKSFKDKIDKFKFITNKNHLNFPLVQMKNRSTKKRNDNKINSSPTVYNNKKSLISIYNKNVKKNSFKVSLNRNNKNTSINNPLKIINKSIDNNDISKEKTDNKNKKPFMNYKKNDMTCQTYTNLDENYHSHSNTNYNSRLSNKNINTINKSSNYNYYLTSSNFISTSDSLNNKIGKKGINNYFLYRTNNNNLSSNKTYKCRNYNLNNNAQKFIKTANNSFKTTSKKNIGGIMNLKKIPKIKLNYWKLLELENSFNEAYNNNFTDVNEKKKDIKKEKEKCKHILEELDKQNNYAIQQIIQEINSHLLGLNFNDFYNYLLTILKNYDKKIVNWSFDIVEDKKGCPEELKFKNVRHRHQKFKGMLERQYVFGVNVNKNIDHLIKNSKNILGFNNEDNYEQFILNNNKQKDNLIDNLFIENNYTSKFYEKFLKNTNNKKRKNNIDS